MGGRDQRQQAFFTAGCHPRQIIRQYRLEGFLILPFGVLGGQRLYPIKGECQLKVHRLLRPERAVVVENGDALGRVDKFGTVLGGDLLDKLHDGPLGLTVVPGGQRVGSGSRRRWRQRRGQGDRQQKIGSHSITCGGNPFPDAFLIGTASCSMVQ